MKFHIVQMNETIEEITFLYNLTSDELKEENRHVKKWDKLIPGTKLKIPVITEAIDSEIIEMEPFIEDYYPKVKNETSNEVFSEENEIKEIEEEEVIIKNEEIDKNEVINEKVDERQTIEKERFKKESTLNKQTRIFPNPYYSYYYYNPIMYYPYYYPIKRKSNH